MPEHLTKSAKTVFHVLVSFNEHQYPWISVFYKKIAEATGLKTKSICNALSELREKGYIEKHTERTWRILVRDKE